MSAVLWVLLALCVAGATSAPALPFAYTIQTGDGKALGLITALNGENRGYSYQVVDPNSETSVIYVEGPEARSFLERYISEIMAIAPEAVERALRRLVALRFPASTGPLGNGIDSSAPAPSPSGPPSPPTGSTPTPDISEPIPNGTPSPPPETGNIGPTRFPNDVFPSPGFGDNNPFGPEPAGPPTSGPESAGPPTSGPESAGPPTSGPESADPPTSGAGPFRPSPFEPESGLPDDPTPSSTDSGNGFSGFPDEDNSSNGESSDSGSSSSDPDSNFPAFSGLPNNPDFLSSELGDRMISELMNRVRSLSSSSGNPAENLALLGEALPSPIALQSEVMDNEPSISTESEISSTTMSTTSADISDMVMGLHAESIHQNELLHGNAPETTSEPSTTSSETNDLHNSAPSERQEIETPSPKLPESTSSGMIEAMSSPESPKIEESHHVSEVSSSESSGPSTQESSHEMATSTRSGPIRIELDLLSRNSEPAPSSMSTTTAAPERRSTPAFGGFQMPNLARVKKTFQSIFKPLIDFF